MNRTRGPTPLILLTASVLILQTGCGNDDDRMWELSRDVTEASRELVEADAEARKEMIQVHRDLQEERSSLDRQHEELEAERREIAAQRHRDPLIANFIMTTGLILSGLLPLAVAFLLLRQHLSQSDDGRLADVLIAEITASDSPLLPAERENRRLPGPDETAEPSDDGTPDGERPSEAG